jgi:hypothetical protein
LKQNKWQQYSDEEKGYEKISNTGMVHKRDLERVWGHNDSAIAMP